MPTTYAALPHPNARAGTVPISAPTPPLRMALLGAAGNGRAALAHALALGLQKRGRPTVLVPFEDVPWHLPPERRPGVQEHPILAHAHAHRVLAVPAHCTVVADGTALLHAVYSDLCWGDASLYPFALQHLRGYHAIMLTALDDSLPRTFSMPRSDGALTPAAVHARLRHALTTAGLAYSIVDGKEDQGVKTCLQAIDFIASRALQTGTNMEFGTKSASTHPRNCAHCGDPDCERRLFTALLRQRAGTTPPGCV